MKLNNEFTVAAPLTRTWDTLLDVERVAACLPGATLEPVGEDGTYRGSMRIKVGPVSLSYSGTVRLADADADEHAASFDVRATETRGTGTAAATIRNRLEPAGDGTRVLVETDLDVTGRPAQFGRGSMQDVAAKMLGEFAGRLEQLVLEGPPPGAAEPAAGEPAAEPVGAAGDSGFDLGSALVRGYSGQLAVAAGGILAVLALRLLRGRRRDVTVTVRLRL